MLAKEKKGPGPEKFDLEKDLISHPQKSKEMIAKIEKEKAELKNLLRTGISKQDFELGGALVAAFDAAEKVIKHITTIKR